MKNFTRIALAALALACVMFTQYASSQGRRFAARGNVLVDCPDPAVIQPKENGPVYVFGTGYGIPIFRSDDLYHWNRAGRVFPDDVPAWTKSSIPGSRGAWAPDIRWFNGRYYLYYAVSTFGSQHSVIGLATNKSLDPASPDYRWQDQGLVLESRPGKTDYNAIDPAMIFDRDKQPYLFWGSFWTGIKAARLDPQTGKLPPAAKITAVAARAQASIRRPSRPRMSPNIRAIGISSFPGTIAVMESAARTRSWRDDRSRSWGLLSTTAAGG